jgi:tryptophan 2,3-dioxygenase
MRAPFLAVGLFFMLSTCAFAQGEQSAIRAREASAADRMRGEKVLIVDQTMKPGRDVNLAVLQKKTVEMNELMKAVNAELQNLQNGVRAADLPKKLKQLEKLAKEIRQNVE